jgi:nucleoside-diphosphate-sugar epimerase
MRYLVTGATGFIGSRVVRQLRDAGHEVVALVRDPGRARQLDDLGVRLVAGQLADRESLEAAMRGVDGVFHLAGWYHIGARDKRPAHRTNVEGTRQVLQAMRDLGIRRGVYTSTLAVNSDTRGRLLDESYRYEGRHLSVYDRTKAEAHRLAEEFMARGLPLTVVMPGLVYGPGDSSSVRSTLVQYLRRRLPLAPARTAFSWAHVEDAARAHLLAMEKGQPGRTYMICGPTHTLVEALQIARGITGLPLPPIVPPWVLKLLAAVMTLGERLLPVPDAFTAEGLRVAAGTTYIGDNTRARRELGWEPRSLQEGLRETLAHELRLLGSQGSSA